MKRTLFTKFCRERKEEYQIMTQICQEDGVKYVEKAALTEAACEHVSRMEKNAEILKELYRYSGFRVCDCELTGPGQVRFPFLTSYSFVDAVNEAENFEALKKCYSFLYQVLMSQKGLTRFEITEEFRKVFGNLPLKDNLFAVPVSNIDMIAANLLKDEDGIWTLVDYEWVFPFPVPVEFIYARSIFLEERPCSLPKEQQMELYAIAGISEKEAEIYYSMEIAFQEYAAGEGEVYSLNRFYKSLHRKVVPFERVSLNDAMFSLILREAETGKKELDYVSVVDFDKVVKLKTENAEDDAKLEVLLSLQDGVIKIRSFCGYRAGEKMALDFASNAALVIGDNYYFANAPVLGFVNQNYEHVELDYQIYWSGHGVAPELIRLILSEKHYRDEVEAVFLQKQSVEEERKKERQARIEAEERERQLRSQIRNLEQELNAMRQRKVVKMADAVHGVLKKEKK